MWVKLGVNSERGSKNINLKLKKWPAKNSPGPHARTPKILIWNRQLLNMQLEKTTWLIGMIPKSLRETTQETHDGSENLFGSGERTLIATSWMATRGPSNLVTSMTHWSRELRHHQVTSPLLLPPELDQEVASLATEEGSRLDYRNNLEQVSFIGIFYEPLYYFFKYMAKFPPSYGEFSIRRKLIFSHDDLRII